MQKLSTPSITGPQVVVGGLSGLAWGMARPLIPGSEPAADNRAPPLCVPGGLPLELHPAPPSWEPQDSGPFCGGWAHGALRWARGQRWGLSSQLCPIDPGRVVIDLKPSGDLIARRIT